MTNAHSDRDLQYRQAAAQFGPALSRLAIAYEADPDIRGDLLQDIRLAIWRSFGTFNGQCSLRTWVYRVAHNTAASHVLRRTRLKRSALVTLDELDQLADPGSHGDDAPARQQLLDRVYGLIQQLDPFDRQIIVAYLEEMDAASIGELTGLSPGAVATKIYRIKGILARRFQQGE